MTTVYFIRHAQSDRFTTDDRARPLTALGLSDTPKITAALADKGITHIISSPYTRTLQTVSDLAKALDIQPETDEDFRERAAGKWHGDRFFEFIERQWADFSYRIEDGESLAEVQKRNIAALKRVLEKYAGETVAIATHGTALSTVINYFYPDFGYSDFIRIVDFMPYVIRMDFADTDTCTGKEEILMVERRYN